MIGAGIFTTSGYTLESLRDPKLVLFAWFAAGLLALCGAYSYGLLVQRMPVSGGEYAFLSQAAHPFAGFIAGWVSLLAGFSGAIAFAAIAMESYLPGALPSKVLAASVVILGALIHGAKRIIGISTQNIAVILKLILLAIFLSFSTWSATQGKWPSNSLPLTEEGIGLLAFAQAMVWISLSYSGFNAGVYVAGEATSPRVVSRSLITGTAIVTLLYLLLNAAFVLAPPPSEISGQADIAAHAARWIGGESFATFTRLVISLALFTSVLSMMMAGPRVYGKMAEDGILPKVFILRPDCTWPAVTLQMSLALLLIFITNLQDLLAFLGLTLSLSASASVSLSLPRRPHKTSPWSHRSSPAHLYHRHLNHGHPPRHSRPLASPRHYPHYHHRRRRVSINETTTKLRAIHPRGRCLFSRNPWRIQKRHRGSLPAAAPAKEDPRHLDARACESKRRGRLNSSPQNSGL